MEKAKLRQYARDLRRNSTDTEKHPSVPLPRDRFWDIQVPEIDSSTRQVFWPRLSCV
ncbi:MAG: hypothetical protein K0U24_06125 [Gammaproteobacteria bacterium]|nr:hypothetical protein [Gammaproteobacteria bacterium]MCH9763781.1 hypothetical protein [Gammaproteobacteria bacterium]